MGDYGSNGDYSNKFGCWLADDRKHRAVCQRVYDAMKFADEIEAYEYIERHGLEKISSVRKL